MEFSLTAEQRALREQVLRFAREEIVPRVREHDLAGRFDLRSFRRLGELGVLGLHLDPEHGGSGASAVTCVAVGEALGEAGVDGGLALSYGAHSFLCADTIEVHGTAAQRARWLPGLASGERIGCMALTEPGAGSDVAALSTRAERIDGGYRITGRKMFITNGSIADVAVVFAKTDPEAGHDGITAFVVEKGTPGFSAGRDLHKLGMRSSVTSELVLEDCVVPVEHRLGEEGAGFLAALQAVEWDRSTLLAPFLGQMQFLVDRCCGYARDRTQFGRAIANFQAVKHRIADLRIVLEASRALVYRVAWCKDQGRPMNPLEAACAKLFVGDASLGPTNDALVVHGGYGYCHEYDVERVFRDARLGAIGGGTSDIQKLVLSRLLDAALA
ncbi:acyl-CoA dehydrogenase family protein [Anaeromyxobacter oryzae]|uniref:Acyl-CoA dehydrogenase n=1 Tax=Anaeromyxobacter oryzae TaxID=2918170 RepID=A0ABM7WSH4_9BACT|nr:acyl-CoA dehydrogenase family protein [Anaeromyxobacter oryzae]BDG02426.1 acyl-CoA dehydrogenase [Anaeromyxobacter oryzae]